MSAPLHAGIHSPGPEADPTGTRGSHPPARPPPRAETPLADTHLPWADTPQAGTPWQTPPYAVHAGIWSTSGRYTSRWNAFLFSIRTESLASSQSFRSIDTDAWCKQALTNNSKTQFRFIFPSVNKSYSHRRTQTTIPTMDSTVDEQFKPLASVSVLVRSNYTKRKRKRKFSSFIATTQYE